MVGVYIFLSMLAPEATLCSWQDVKIQTLTLFPRCVSDVTANSHGTTYPYDVTVTRRETEGFGFVIISSVTKSGSTLGEFIGTYSRRGLLLLLPVVVTLSCVCVCQCGMARPYVNRVTDTFWPWIANSGTFIEHASFYWWRGLLPPGFCGISDPDVSTELDHVLM